MKSLTQMFRAMFRPRAFVCAALVAVSSTSAQAGPVLFNAAGTGAGGATLVGTFDESVGNALAVNAVTLINAQIAAGGGTTGPFALYYQANVVLQDPTGATINTGPNVITAVAKFFEVATVTPGSNTVVFSNAANQTGAYFDFFAHTGGAIGNNSTGVGFANDTPGTLIYSATATAGGPQNGNFTNTGGSVPIAPGSSQQTNNGFGGSVLTFNTNYFNSNYFIGTPGPSISLLTTNNLPFLTVPPSSQFVNLTGAGPGSTFAGYVLPSIGTLNGSTGPDVQLQSDASSSFAVPEPASVAMTAMGLVGLGAFASRRRKAAVV